MTNNRTILITGVTGNQGGAVAQALQGAGFHLRGLTRKPDSELAAALARRGVDIVKGDLDDEATLRRALAGAWGVFGVQNAGEAGVEREEAQGKRLATLAREAGVEHYVYTSVGSAHKRTGIPHFDNKWRIEETVRGLRFPSHVILRPVFFMENLLAPYSLQGPTLAWAFGPGTKLQMIAVDDIGFDGLVNNAGRIQTPADVLVPFLAALLSRLHQAAICVECLDDADHASGNPIRGTYSGSCRSRPARPSPSAVPVAATVRGRLSAAANGRRSLDSDRI
jgi:NAD(P)-dependent dehydrogenase (short-subunit alcohol dehydrogenase family)